MKINVYYSWHNDKYRGTFNTETLQVRVKGEWYTPTSAAKAAVNGKCNSVNGWVCWKLAKASKVRGKTFDAGTVISDLRKRLKVTINKRPASSSTGSKASSKKASSKGKGKGNKASSKKAKPSTRRSSKVTRRR